MNIGTAVVLGLVLGACALAVKSMIKNRGGCRCSSSKEASVCKTCSCCDHKLRTAEKH